MNFFVILCFTVVIYSSAFPTPPKPMIHSTVLRRIVEPAQLEEESTQWDTISAMKYLGKFGYMSKRKMRSQLGSLIDIRSYTKAIRKFQKMFNLEPTGELDDATQRMMSLPRCGVKDTPRPSKLRRNSRSRALKRKGVKSRSKRFVLQGGKWSKKVLTYHILNYTPDLTKEQVQIAIQRAFNLWANYTNIEFKRTENSRLADIKISFAVDDHGDYYPFDGKGGELAHAYYPSDGRAHFDDAELFSFEGNQRGIDLFTVAAHEFGHNLGLSHSGVSDALMAPVYRGYKPNLTLHKDDIQGIQDLYGKKAAPSDENDLCRSKKPIDAMHYDMHEEVFYVFVGDKFWKIKDKEVVDGYPKKIKQLWKGLPENIDASMYSQTTRRTYFFKGNKIWRFNDFKRLEVGFPQPSSALGLPSNPDAAVQLRRDAMVYVFKNGNFYQFSEYQRYNGANFFGSRRIGARWRNLPSKIDAVVRRSNGQVFFVKDDRAWGFSSSGSPLNKHKPASFKATWLNCSK